jgi:hypothetical protein
MNGYLKYSVDQKTPDPKEYIYIRLKIDKTIYDVRSQGSHSFWRVRMIKW